MNGQRWLMALTGANLLLLIGLMAAGRSTGAQGVTPVLRAHALEIVDRQGRVRASLIVQPPDPHTTVPGGGTVPETVILRLIDPYGRPSVKIAASEQGAGLSFTGHANSRDTWVVLKAEGTASSLKLRNEDAREQVITP
jgi:hypothetical protein